ncbi:Uncharacterised protein [BD1-7 clade bacterium]|uniref:Uncharacterized protein n=1 Tax=BD1-7 clade bacterium TaxID=2029982 RepID=A0A5S9QGJ9_9GAMM|nr:Uncharacterised protein [BD1-7 clade bacterium]CAA0117797.1 Uncharacterised protein [BD1-7 clade bacterium]
MMVSIIGEKNVCKQSPKRIHNRVMGINQRGFSRVTESMQMKAASVHAAMMFLSALNKNTDATRSIVDVRRPNFEAWFNRSFFDIDMSGIPCLLFP